MLKEKLFRSHKGTSHVPCSSGDPWAHNKGFCSSRAITRSKKATAPGEDFLKAPHRERGLGVPGHLWANGWPVMALEGPVVECLTSIACKPRFL